MLVGALYLEERVHGPSLIFMRKMTVWLELQRPLHPFLRPPPDSREITSCDGWCGGVEDNEGRSGTGTGLAANMVPGRVVECCS